MDDALTARRQSQSGKIGRGAIGALQRDGRYLLIRRAAGVPRGGAWCFPGGHVDPGECSRVAVVRELGEELSLIVEATEKLGHVRVPEFGYVLAVWRVRQVGGTIIPAPAEIAEVRWCTGSEMRALEPSLASNQVVFEMLGVPGE